MCLILPPLSINDNKVLKLSIGYANICSSVQDHRLKIYKSLIQVLVLKERMRAMESTKEAYVAN